MPAMSSAVPQVHRPRLMAAFDAIKTKRALFLIAPAGFGKTVALQQYLENLRFPHAYVALDDGLTQRGRSLWRELTEQLSALEPGLTQILGALESSDPGLEDAVQALANLTVDWVLAIDRYELAEQRSSQLGILRQLLPALLTDQRLSRGHLLLASRISPSFPHMRLLLQGQLEIIYTNQLSFTTAEVREYLERARGEAQPPGVARSRWIETSGWPAGVALLEERGRPAVFQYLDEEVLPTLPAEVAEFAIAASPLDSLAPSVCDLVLGRSDSTERSREIETLNLFVDRTASGYPKLQPLFQQYLQSKLPRATRAEVQSRAGTLLAHLPDVPGALRHYTLAKAWDLLIPLLQEHGRSLIESGHASDVHAALSAPARQDALPPDLVLLHAETYMRLGAMPQGATALSLVNRDELAAPQRHQLAILEGWLALFESRPNDALGLAEQGLAAGDCPPFQHAHFLRLAGAAHGMLRQNAPAEQRGLAALAAFQAIHSLAEAGYQKMELGGLMFDRCELQAAASWLREAVDTFEKLERGDYLPAALAQLGRVLAELGELDEALSLLARARKLVADWPDHPVVADILRNIGIAYWALQRPRLAEEAFRGSERVSRRVGHTAGEQAAILGLAITHAHMGRVNEARTLIEPLRNRCASHLVRMRFLMAELSIAWHDGQDDEALTLCDRLLLSHGSAGSAGTRYARTAALFRLASLVRLEAPRSAVEAAASTVVYEFGESEFVALIHRDVARVAAAGARAHPDPRVRNSPLWKLTGKALARVDDVGLNDDWLTTLEVRALQPSLGVRLNGQVYEGSWHSALDVFLYLVHRPEGGTALEVAHALWGSRASEHALQQRFHTMLSALRRILGESSIIRGTATRPSRYQLRPDLAITYDVARLEQLARSLLAANASEAQLPALSEVRQLRAASYWPARELRSPWFSAIDQHIEQLYVRLLDREIALRSSVDNQDVAELRALLDHVRTRNHRVRPNLRIV